MWVNGTLWLLIVIKLLGAQIWFGFGVEMLLQAMVLVLSISTYLSRSYQVVWPLCAFTTVCMLTQQNSIGDHQIAPADLEIQDSFLRMSCGYSVIIITLGRAVFCPSIRNGADFSVLVGIVLTAPGIISGIALRPVMGLLLSLLVLQSAIGGLQMNHSFRAVPMELVIKIL